MGFTNQMFNLQSITGVSNWGPYLPCTLIFVSTRYPKNGIYPKKDPLQDLNANEIAAKKRERRISEDTMEKTKIFHSQEKGTKQTNSDTTKSTKKQHVYQENTW